MFERLEERYGPDAYESWVPDKLAPAKKPAVAKPGRPKNQECDVADLITLRLEGGHSMSRFSDFVGVSPDIWRRVENGGLASPDTIDKINLYRSKTHSKRVQQKQQKI
jgi:hypothetical protein